MNKTISRAGTAQPVIRPHRHSAISDPFGPPAASDVTKGVQGIQSFSATLSMACRNASGRSSAFQRVRILSRQSAALSRLPRRIAKLV